MTASEWTFRCLALCAQRPGHPLASARLRSELTAPPRWDALVDEAERHGLEPLLGAHLRAAGIPVPSAVGDRLRVRQMQHAHALSVRTRVAAEVAEAMAQARIPLLVLKGAAVAQLVYADARLRVMRDLDLLVRKQDAGRASTVLARCGFVPGGLPVASDHHHLPGVSRTVDGATMTIELHHELLSPTPFLRPVEYDDLAPASQSFDWDGLTFRTLGREDMLWHVYAHAFVTHTLCPGIRLASLADLVHATEAWVDVLDWHRLRRQYGRLFRALPLVHHLTPWSRGVAERLGGGSRRAPSGIRPVASSLEWSGALHRDVLWPPDWWFRMRYGIAGPSAWCWYRFAGHPARLAMAAAWTALRRGRQAALRRP